MKLSVITILLASSLFLVTACNKEKNQDVLKIGYQYPDSYESTIGTSASSGATITVGGFPGSSSEILYTGIADQTVTIAGKSVPGLEEVTGSKDFTDGTSGQFKIHVIVNDTISNIGEEGYWGVSSENTSVNWDAGNDRKRDVFEGLMDVVVTYENWWHDSYWKLDSSSMNGVSGTPATCAEDNELHIFNEAVNGNYTVSLDYNEGSDVCNGANQEESGSLKPYAQPDNLRSLEISLQIFDNANSINFYFTTLKFRSKDLITLEGNINGGSGGPVLYYMSRK